MSTLTNQQKYENNKCVKLICGASNEDLASIEDLCAIYSAAGVDYIDIAADPSVADAARSGINWSMERFGNIPKLMVSISDGKDIHFRKATFNPSICPEDCPRPCEKICPTFAINHDGINKDKCYGCGRCINSCPLNLISEYEYRLSQNSLKDILQTIKPDAIEIHTAINRAESFKKVAKIIKNSRINLKSISVSCGLSQSNAETSDLIRTFWERYSILKEHGAQLIWQLDGRPMSGDLAASATKAAVKLWETMRNDLPPGLIQLAGGTNGNTYKLFKSNKLPDGIAFGGAARKLVQPIIEDSLRKNQKIYENPEKMHIAITKAKALMNPWKNKKEI